METERGWKAALAAATRPGQADVARERLIALLLEARRYDDCLVQVDEAVQKTTDVAVRVHWLNVRPTVLGAKGDIDGALQALEALISTAAPEHRVELRLRQARAAASAQRWNNAAEYFEGALSEILDDAAHASERRVAVRLEKVQVVGTHAVDRVENDLDTLDSEWTAPGWPTPIDLRIGALVATGRTDDALAWLNQRLERSPEFAEHPAAYQWRAEIEMKRRHIDDALALYARALERSSAVSDARALAAALVAATATLQWEAAVDAYKGLSATDTAFAANPMVRVFAGLAHLRLGELQTALAVTDGVEPPLAAMSILRHTLRAEAQLRLRQHTDALASTAAALERHGAPDSGAMSTDLLLSLY
ncbi:MAG TPA: hypothetical protein VFI62_08270, partial [Burkholderiales bacterium]|nr:hypothetical protein [Burkholderiales bacterium]